MGARVTPASRGKNPPAAEAPLLPIGRLARRNGVSVDTIRYYEKIGLLPPPPRTEGGQRLYPPALGLRLHFIRRARALGFPLGEIRELLALADGTPASCAEAAVRAERQLAAIRSHLAHLSAMAAALEQLLAACSRGSAGPCPLIEALSGAEDGPASLPPPPSLTEAPYGKKNRGERARRAARRPAGRG